MFCGEMSTYGTKRTNSIAAVMSANDPKQTFSGRCEGYTGIPPTLTGYDGLVIGGRHTFELDGSRWTARYLECRDDYVLAL